MKSVSWTSISANVRLQLGDNPLLEITDRTGGELIFNVTQEDLEGISDILTDGRFHLKREEEKKQEELQEVEFKKKAEEFRKSLAGGFDFGGILNNASEKIMEKLSKEFPTKTECAGDCGMNYCDENGCQERERILVDPIGDMAEKNVSVSGDTHRGEGKEESNG